MSTDIKKHWHPRLSCSKNWFLGVHFGGSSRRGGISKLCQNIYLVNICWYPKTLAPLSKSVQKINFFGVHFGGITRGRWYPQTTSKYLFVKYLLISKETCALAWAVKKINFLAPFRGGSRWGHTKKFWETKLRLQLNSFAQKLDFDVLWFRRAYKIKEKKEKTLLLPKVSW